MGGWKQVVVVVCGVVRPQKLRNAVFSLSNYVGCLRLMRFALIRGTTPIRARRWSRSAPPAG